MTDTISDRVVGLAIYLIEWAGEEVQSGAPSRSDRPSDVEPLLFVPEEAERLPGSPTRVPTR